MSTSDPYVSDELVNLLQDLSAEQLIRLLNKIESMANYEPKIGILGKAGVGKSYLCNTLFGGEPFKVGDVEPTTREPQELILTIGAKGLKLVDFPGVGESEKSDQKYYDLYRQWLPQFDMVLWLVKADDRAYEPEERSYREVVKPVLPGKIPFLVLISQIDKIEPYREFDWHNHVPGPNQLLNIQHKVEMVRDVFTIPHSHILPISALGEYNLVKLVELIVSLLPADKQYSFVKETKDEYVSKEVRDTADKSFWNEVKKYAVWAGFSAAGLGIGALIYGITRDPEEAAKVFKKSISVAKQITEAAIEAGANAAKSVPPEVRDAAIKMAIQAAADAVSKKV